MPSAPVDARTRLRRCMLLAVVAQLLLVGAGLRHNLIWGESEARPWQLPLLNALEAACLLGFTVLAGMAWWRAMRAPGLAAFDSRRLTRMTWVIVGAAVLVPLLSTTDPIDYVMRGRIVALHGGNPYLQVANDFADDPFVQFGDSGWKDMPLPYGPIVANLQGAVAWLAHLVPGGDRVELVAALLLFKLVFASALLLSARWLGDIAERMRPGSRNMAFVAVMWNPMLLFECVANAHNEPLVLLCLVGAVAAATAARFGWAMFALGCGVLTKIIPGLLVPLVGLASVRERKVPAALVGGVAIAPLLALFYWQFFTDPAAFEVWGRQGELVGGSFWWAVHSVTGLDLGSAVRFGRIAVMAWLAYCCVRVLRLPHPREIVFATASSLLMLAVLGAPLFGAWYHVWWLPFALLLREGYVYRVAVVASISSPAAYLVWCGMRRLDDPAQWWIVSVAVFAPLVLALRGGRAPAARMQP